MTPERKKRALEMIDTAHPSTGILPSGLQALRDLIDPPISALSRAELETEVAELRRLVEALRRDVEQHKERADALSRDLDSLRQNIRHWRGALLSRTFSEDDLWKRVSKIADEMLCEFRRSDG